MTQAVVLHPCGRCGSTRLWDVRELKEAEGPLAVAYEVHRYGTSTISRFGTYELLVCAGCGHFEWFARHFDPGPGVHGVDDCRVSCSWCKTEGKGWRVQTAQERVMDDEDPTRPLFLYLFIVGGGMGRFSVTLCARCGHAVWTGYDLNIQPSPWRGLAAVDGEKCRGCGNRGRLRRTPLLEQSRNTQPLAVAAKRVLHFFELRRGTINVDVCRTCGWTEWNVDPLTLEEGLEGLSMIDLAEQPPEAPRGPYR